MTGESPEAGADLWQRAAAFAARAHIGQVRKDDSTPYASHPARVAMTLLRVFGCEDDLALAAAYLHDTIEDTPADYDDIEEGFGKIVADIVAALTKNMILPEPEREPEYDQRLRAADWRARLIKLADVYDNLCDIEFQNLQTADLVHSTRQRHLARCERAIALAAEDAKTHPETARAITAVRQRISSHPS
jgi:(p)ppGpp synthase/HD superfamily hydrolase